MCLVGERQSLDFCEFCPFRVQEQENQKQQLREELDRLKAPLDSREASSQTPDHLQQVLRLTKQLLSLPGACTCFSICEL